VKVIQKNKLPAMLGQNILNLRWHDLRHTWATWLRQLGTPTHELQRMGAGRRRRWSSDMLT
jgi:integrase